MWKKERNCVEESGSSELDPSAKRAKTGNVNIIVCELSKSRRITVRRLQGKTMVDIREFYLKDGKQLPGKKGISLPLEQWEILHGHITEINQALKEHA